MFRNQTCSYQSVTSHLKRQESQIQASACHETLAMTLTYRLYHTPTLSRVHDFSRFRGCRYQVLRHSPRRQFVRRDSNIQARSPPLLRHYSHQLRSLLLPISLAGNKCHRRQCLTVLVGTEYKHHQPLDLNSNRSEIFAALLPGNVCTPFAGKGSTGYR